MPITIAPRVAVDDAEVEMHQPPAVMHRLDCPADAVDQRHRYKSVAPLGRIGEWRDIRMGHADRLIGQDRYALLDEPGKLCGCLWATTKCDDEIGPVINRCGGIGARSAATGINEARNGSNIWIPNASHLRAGIQYPLGVHAGVPVPDPKHCDAHHPLLRDRRLRVEYRVTG